MAAFAAGTKVRKKASPMPTEDGYDDPQKAGENVALNANCWDVYSKSDCVRWHGALRCSKIATMAQMSI